MVNSHTSSTTWPVHEATQAVIARAEVAGWGQGQARCGGCATGACRASATGARRSRSSHCETCGVVPVPQATSCPSRCPRMSISPRPATRSSAIRRGSTSTCPKCGGAASARDRHARYLRQFELVFPALRQPARRCAVRPRRGRAPGCRSTSISAASSTRSCTLLYARFWTRALASYRQVEVARALRQPVHARHGHARDLQSHDKCFGQSKRDGSLRTDGLTLCAAESHPLKFHLRTEDWCEIGRWLRWSRSAASIKMSKSKKNVVDPEDIIARYGADAVRWFMLSDSPPERDLPWSAAGIEGCARFVQRLWRLFGELDPAATRARTRMASSRARLTRPSPRSARTSRRWRSTRPSRGSTS